MIRRVVRKRLATVVIAALCMTICCPSMKEQIPAEAAETGTVDSASENSSMNRWTPTSSWEEEEVVEQLDNDNIDENGYTYKLTVRGATYTAKLTEIEMTRYRGARQDIMIRVPDKVEKDGVEYVVTQCSLEPSDYNLNIKKNFRLYIGKGIQQVYCGNFLYAIVSYVHSSNENYISRDGVLFSKDETVLLRYGSEKYEPERIYTLPEQVEKIHPSAFIKADVKEVVLNDKITELPLSAFKRSYLQKIDLKSVNKIDRYVFSGCWLLKEVKINCCDVEIGEMAFANTGIENLYIPPGAVLDGMNIVDDCWELETVVMGEGSKILAESDIVHGSSNSSIFSSDIKLKTLIFSEGITEIPKACLGMCCMLRKLYVPDSVETIRSFNTKGKFTLYGRNKDVMETYEGNAAFVNISGHKHVMKEVTFFEYDSWGVKGKYCEECGYGCDTELVEYVGGNTKEEMPELLCIPEEKCPEKLSLDEENRDSQGVVYQLDDVNGTAKAVGVEDTFDCGFVAFPETVEKNGKTYVLETIGEFALNISCARVLISDSVKNIEDYALGSAMDIVLGRNVSHIEKYAFCNVRGNIHLPEDNVNFKVLDDVIYTADGRELIAYCGGMLRKELTIPASVEKIWNRAFYARGNWLETILVCGDEGKFKDDVFPYNTDIIYMGQIGESDGQEPPVSSTLEPEETVSPTPEPTPEETVSPTPEPKETVSPTPEPTPEETVSPTSEPNETVSPTPEPKETVSPTPEETVSPTSEPKETVSPTPEPKETVSPTPKPRETLTPFSTEPPFETELPDIPDMVQRNSQHVPNSNVTSDDGVQGAGASSKQNLSVTGLRLSTKDNRSVTLKWKVNTAARYYQIYRAERKSGSYKVIRTVRGNRKNSCVDKNVRPLKKYYYKVSAMRSYEGTLEEGGVSPVRSIRVSGIMTPKIKVKKGRQENDSYVSIMLKKYQGKYADIYTSFNGKKYNKLKLVSNRIARYRGRFKIRYVVVKKLIHIKVRTWQGRGKKKRYSNFSNVVKVKV